jgi:hypothetical protein
LLMHAMSYGILTRNGTEYTAALAPLQRHIHAIGEN